MAIVVVRQATTIDSSSNVASPQFTGTPTAGNNIIATSEGFNGSGATISSVVDDASGGSNSYSTESQVADNGGPSTRAGVTRAKVVNTLSNLTVTVTYNASSVVCATAIEVSGLADSPLDIATSIGTDSASPYPLATGTLNQADEIIVAAYCFNATGLGNHGVAVDSWSGNAPTTLFINDGAGINSEYGAAAYLIVSSTSSITTQFSSTSAPGAGCPLAVATYKAAVAPTLTSPVGTALSSLSARVGATTDQATGVLYAVITTSSTAPTPTQIKAGQDHTGSAAVKAGEMMVSASGALTLDLYGLTPSTGYYAHLVHTTSAGDSNVVSSAQFTTPSHGFATGTGPRSVPLYGGGPLAAGTFGQFTRSTEPAAGGVTTSSAVSDGGGQAAAPVNATNAQSAVSDGGGQANAPVNATNAQSAVSDGAGQAAAPTQSPTGAVSAAPGQASAPTQSPAGAVSAAPGQATAPTQSPAGAVSAGAGQATAPTQSPVGAVSDGGGQAATPAVDASGGGETITSGAVSDGGGQAAAPVNATNAQGAVSDGGGQAAAPAVYTHSVAAVSAAPGQATTGTESPAGAVSAAPGQASSPTHSPVGAVSDGGGQAATPTRSPVGAVSDGGGQAAADAQGIIILASGAVSDGGGQAYVNLDTGPAPTPSPAPPDWRDNRSGAYVPKKRAPFDDVQRQFWREVAPMRLVQQQREETLLALIIAAASRIIEDQPWN